MFNTLKVFVINDRWFSTTNIQTYIRNVAPLATFAVILVVAHATKHLLTPGGANDHIGDGYGLEGQGITKIIDTTEKKNP
jgi:hypothetical protein